MSMKSYSMLVCFILCSKIMLGQVYIKKDNYTAQKVTSSCIITGISGVVFVNSFSGQVERKNTCYILSGVLFSTGIYLIRDVIKIKIKKRYKIRPKTY